MPKFLYFLVFLFPVLAKSQKIVHDWENYVVSLNGKPVSINVDMGFKSFLPVKEDSMVIIMRLRLNQTDRSGMPKQEETELLLNMEDRLVEMLARQSGAKFVGRFTQRSIREFYFYASDTSGYRKALNEAMRPFGQYEWLAQAKKDSLWENYTNVLYPTPMDFLRIQSNRKIQTLTLPQNGSKIGIDHFISFSDAAQMKKFLQLPEASDFQLVTLPSGPDASSGKWELVLRRKEYPGRIWIEQVIVPLYQKLLNFGAIYRGWEPSPPSPRNP